MRLEIILNLQLIYYNQKSGGGAVATHNSNNWEGITQTERQSSG